MKLVDVQFETKCIHSLVKVFPDEALAITSLSSGSSLLNETYSFQVAYCANKLYKPIHIHVQSELSDCVTLRKVGLVPAELPCIHDDGDYMRTTPGLFPDPLYPIDAEGITALPGQWRSIWVTVEPAGNVKPGNYSIDIVFVADDGREIARETFTLQFIHAELPEQTLTHTEWFHTDCLATYYNVDVFSEEHWRIVERYVATAVKHGINMILTPLFTPPLDTQVGCERPTVQLVDVVKQGDQYTFGFEKLERWVEMCDRQGVRYFEFSHLFTQWGAKHAPKIVAKVVDGDERGAESRGVSVGSEAYDGDDNDRRSADSGKLQRIFGWDTDAGGAEYRSFLAQFLPELVKFIQENGLEKRSYFHVSDEPYSDHLEQYKSNSEFLRQYLGEFPMIDALSDYAFYELGVVKHPIPANDHIDPFIAGGVKPLWTYYCVSQWNKVSNRFFALPSARNRIIGVQLYKFDADGFLHWGYNFWYSQYSRKAIDPFKVTDADLAFTSGDAYLVYPGEDGHPIESIRMEVFFEALQDLRALRLLESLIGRDRVLSLLEEGLESPITFSEYPRDADWLLQLRERINSEIAKHIQN